MKNKFNKTTLARLTTEGKPAIINDQVEKGLKFKAGPRRSVFIFEKRISGSKGAPITFTLGTFKALSISEARQEARRLATLCEKGIDPRVRPTDAKVITLELAIKTFLEIKESEKLSKSSFKGYMYGISFLPEEWFARDINEINHRVLATLYRSIFKKTAHGAKGMLITLSVIWNTCEEHFEGEDEDSLLGPNPVPKVLKRTKKLKLPKPNTPVIPRTHLGKFIVSLERMIEGKIKFPGNAIGHHSKRQTCALSLLCLFTGMRKGEAASLQWKDVDLTNGVIHLLFTKNKKEHWVSLSSHIWEFLKKWREEYPETKYVFQAKTDERPSFVDYRFFQFISETVGIEYLPHAARRTFGSIANEAGVNFVSIKRMMNHTDHEGDVTWKYIKSKFNPDKNREYFQAVCDYILELRKPELEKVKAQEVEEKRMKLKLAAIELGFNLEDVASELQLIETGEAKTA